MFENVQRDNEFVKNIINVKKEEIVVSDEEDIYTFIPKEFIDGTAIKTVNLEEHQRAAHRKLMLRKEQIQ
jgi:phage portal protein BeeE